MKPKLIHQQAMEYSFKAKQALEEEKYGVAFGFYKQAAELESQVAEFYFDKPELEPTRSVVVRSAAFMNLKAGLYEKAQKFIFFGLLYTKDDLIKSQLNDALELAVSLKNLTPEAASGEFNYINLLRQRSVHYIIEPANFHFGHSVSLATIRDFSENYLKSLKAFAKSKFKKLVNVEADFEEIFAKEIDKLINPLVTNSAYGSFKLSIANDFQTREGEEKKIVELKSNVVIKFHNEIFINPLSDVDIKQIKESYTEEEVNEIFRPLTKIKSNNTPYKVGYYDSENLNKTYATRIINKQREKLLSVKPISQQDIGELESSIIHKRSVQGGKVTKKTIFKEQLRAYEFDIKIHQLEPKDVSPVLLNEEILLSIYFNSENGFKFSFADIPLEYTDTEYDKGLIGFYTLLYHKILSLVDTKDKNEQEFRDWEVVKRLIGNPDALRK